jgi:hypothetical protein
MRAVVSQNEALILSLRKVSRVLSSSDILFFTLAEFKALPQNDLAQTIFYFREFQQSDFERVFSGELASRLQFGEIAVRISRTHPRKPLLISDLFSERFFREDVWCFPFLAALSGEFHDKIKNAFWTKTAATPTTVADLLARLEDWIRRAKKQIDLTSIQTQLDNERNFLKENLSQELNAGLKKNIAARMGKLDEMIRRNIKSLGYKGR